MLRYICEPLAIIHLFSKLCLRESTMCHAVCWVLGIEIWIEQILIFKAVSV